MASLFIKLVCGVSIAGSHLTMVVGRLFLRSLSEQKGRPQDPRKLAQRLNAFVASETQSARLLLA